MFIADATRKLRIKLAGAVTTNQLPVVGWWVKQATPTGAWMDSQPIHAVTNSTTEVDIVASPNTNEMRLLKGLSVVNKDTAAATFVIESYDGSNARELWRAVLAVGDILIYDGEGHFAQYDNNGKLKTLSSATLTDGDYGDITVGGSGTTFTIDNNAVSDAKLRDSAAVSVIGRSANSTGDPADIAAASNDTILRRVANALDFGALTIGMFAANLITYAKIQQVSATARILGRVTAGAGDIEELTPAQIRDVADVEPDNSTIELSGGTMRLKDAGTTLAKLANLAESTVIGRAAGAGTGVPAALTTEQIFALWAESAERCSVRNSADQSINTATVTLITFDTDKFDTDNMHYTSAANLTGTVAKTAASAAVVGTGTAFTTELSVGQVITIPGTATEKFVVTAIANNTNLTLNRNAANTASGQTATRVNTAIVIRTAGTYVFGTLLRMGSNATGFRQAQIYKNNTTVPQTGTRVANFEVPPVNGTSTGLLLFNISEFAQWDIIEVNVYQTSGGALNSLFNDPDSPNFFAYRIGP